ncbi:MAG: hypothetical protein IJ684_01905 [Bacteroidales bacterium]|nr:hypothetical protein [Bacteroidales bacterium]
MTNPVVVCEGTTKCQVFHGQEKRRSDCTPFAIHVSDTVVMEYAGTYCDFDWAAVSAHPERQHHPRTSVLKFVSALEGAVDRVREQEAQPVFLSLPRIRVDLFLRFVSQDCDRENIMRWLGRDRGVVNEWRDRYNDILLVLARDKQVPVIDVASMLDEERFYAPDGLHLSAEGEAVVCDAIARYRL